MRAAARLAPRCAVSLTTMNGAAAVSVTCRSSRSLSPGTASTAAAPMRARARTMTISPGSFGSCTSTRSPGRMPRRRRSRPPRSPGGPGLPRSGCLPPRKRLPPPGSRSGRARNLAESPRSTSPRLHTAARAPRGRRGGQGRQAQAPAPSGRGWPRAHRPVRPPSATRHLRRQAALSRRHRRGHAGHRRGRGRGHRHGHGKACEEIPHMPGYQGRFLQVDVVPGVRQNDNCTAGSAAASARPLRGEVTTSLPATMTRTGTLTRPRSPMSVSPAPIPRPALPGPAGRIRRKPSLTRRRAAASEGRRSAPARKRGPASPRPRYRPGQFGVNAERQPGGQQDERAHPVRCDDGQPEREESAERVAGDDRTAWPPDGGAQVREARVEVQSGDFRWRSRRSRRVRAGRPLRPPCHRARGGAVPSAPNRRRSRAGRAPGRRWRPSPRPSG